MRLATRQRGSAAGRVWARGRVARLLVLLALLGYQPRAVLHAAADEVHLVRPTGSSESAYRAGEPHGHAAPEHDFAPDHARNQICAFCILAGSALTPPSAATAHATTWASAASRFVCEAIRPQRPARIDHRVRAPPRGV